MTTEATDSIVVETRAVEGGEIGVLTLNDPDRRNALRQEMVDGIVAAFDALEGTGVGAVIITGAGRAFCAGADLGNLGAQGESEPGAREQGMMAIYEGFLRVARSPLPTIAAVNGAAVGAGMNLALSCDVRLAAHGARFDTRFLQLGLHPGGGHTWMLERAVGPQTAAAMVMFGQVLAAEEAERRGLVWRAVPDGELMEAAVAMATTAAAAPPELARRVKATLQAVPTMAYQDEAVRLELDSQLWSLGQPFFVERLQALQARISAR